jgi:proteic killer suppression protein
METIVVFTKNADKDLRKLPKEIVRSLMQWIFYLETQGITKTKKIPGYNDEALKGNRKGQRSARLNKAYRVIYIVTEKGELEVVQIEEINKHKY